MNHINIFQKTTISEVFLRVFILLKVYHFNIKRQYIKIKAATDMLVMLKSC